MDIAKDWQALALAALLGTSGGGGISTYLQQSHTHPEIIKEIREVQYESIVEKAKVIMAATPDHTSPEYIIASAQLVKYVQKLADLK